MKTVVFKEAEQYINASLNKNETASSTNKQLLRCASRCQISSEYFLRDEANVTIRSFRCKVYAR